MHVETKTHIQYVHRIICCFQEFICIQYIIIAEFYSILLLLVPSGNLTWQWIFLLKPPFPIVYRRFSIAMFDYQRVITSYPELSSHRSQKLLRRPLLDPVDSVPHPLKPGGTVEGACL